MCEPLHIPEYRLDEYVLYAVRSQVTMMLKTEKVYNGIVESGKYADDSRILKNSIASLQKQLKALEGRRHRLYDSYDDGVITRELYASRFKALIEEVEQVESSIAKAEKEARQYKQVGNKGSDCIELFKKYETVTEVSRELLVALVDKILVENIREEARHRNYIPKKVTIVFNFTDEHEALMRFVEENKLINF